MRSTILTWFSLLFVAAAAPAAAYVDDDFNGPGLGSQWTFHDSTPAGSTITLTAGNLRMLAKEKSDHWENADAYCYVEQDAPTTAGAWEVVTKVQNFNPTQVGFKSFFERTGIQLWQDNDHWLSIGLLSDGTGSNIGIQAYWQTLPTPLPAGAAAFRYFGNNEFTPVTTQPLYLRIQKTNRGYIAGMSADGVTWTDCSPRMRNPETGDGSFTNAKIRLFQSGGNAGNTGVDAPADFDFCHSATTGPLGQTVAGCKSDEFNGAGLDPANWGYYAGFLGGNMSVSAGKLNLQAGYGNDLWENWERPTYVYQDAPTSTSFELEVKAGPADIRTYDLYNEYGIWLWQDQCNWVYIGNQRSNANPVSNRIECGYKRDGVFNAYQVPDFGTGALPGYLRIERNGLTYTAQYSFDGTTWQSVPSGGTTLPHVLANAEVRLFSKSVTNGTQDLNTPKVNAQFDYFHVYPLPAAAADWQLLE
jgi:beta-xylosidase